jgi:predicted TIM-barrel fold metal-dependent hydrolase
MNSYASGTAENPRPVIALEEHMLPKDIASAAGIDPAILLGKDDMLHEVGERRLQEMDRAGIDIQVLSAVNHWAQQLQPAESIAVSRELNDRLGQAVSAHPHRFKAFACLPMTDPAAAADELVRAVEELGFVGALINGQTNGAFLDDPAFTPVLAAAERLEVPIYLHPAVPPPEVQRAYFEGLSPVQGAILATAGWGWHAECGLHVLRLAVSGTLDRFPALQLIVGHMGENLPFSLARADERLTPVSGQLAAGVAETVLNHVHITTCGYTTEPPLMCALEVFGADRMMFSVDYPFSDCYEATAFLRDAPLDEADKDKIAHLNAEQLLKLS